MINPKVVESLFASDLAYLQEFYSRINEDGTSAIPATCPKCEHKFQVEITPPGEL